MQEEEPAYVPFPCDICDEYLTGACLCEHPRFCLALANLNPQLQEPFVVPEPETVAV